MQREYPSIHTFPRVLATLRLSAPSKMHLGTAPVRTFDRVRSFLGDVPGLRARSVRMGFQGNLYIRIHEHPRALGGSIDGHGTGVRNIPSARG